MRPWRRELIRRIRKPVPQRRPAGVRFEGSTLLLTLAVALAVFLLAGGAEEHAVTVHWPALALAAAVFICMRYTPLKKLHPIAFIAAAAAVGAVFQL